jgi:reductive dehalogenase
MMNELIENLPMLAKQMGVKDQELSWEKDFPFKPKSVIVMAVPMDYDNMATAPSKTNGATVGDGYTKMATLASSIAKFIRRLGYKAVASGNDLGLSVAYGIAAGLGEGGRNNQLLVPGYGPRVRLCKVYTDFDFVEYDQPRNWGIEEFCKSCKKCGEACPSGAIDMGDDTHYYFNGEHSEQEGYSWSNHEGVKKFHTDAKKCFDYWMESDTDCCACAAACTFNEPDFWHHWFIMAINPIAPAFLHAAMAELHPAFGYGSTANPEKVKKFWQSGEGLRINMSNKTVFGGAGKA